MKHSLFTPSNAGRDASASLGFRASGRDSQSTLRAFGPNTHNPSQPLPPGRAAFGVFAPPGDGQAIAHWRDWAAHVEAGRIGNNAPTPPDVEARRNARERAWRRIFAGG